MRSVRAIRDLATGGMGRVELVVVRDGAFARAYARKRLLDRLARDGEVRAMFLEEGRIAGLVRHANVVPVIDAGEDEEGPYLLMDLVDGVPLSQLVARSEIGLPVQVTVEIARQIAEGLHAAHELVAPGGQPMELVHRDLSPSNVLVGFDGVVRVTDFGVARAADRAAVTRAAKLAGKQSYMAPEQRRGEHLDRRADLFSLGIVIAEMLRGAPILRDPLESPPDPGDERDDLPPELVALCFELTALDPADRPDTARAVATRLAAIHSALRAEEDPIDLGELVRTSFAAERAAREREMAEILRDVDPTQLELVVPERRRAPRRWALVAVVALGLSGGAALAITTSSDSSSESATLPPEVTTPVPVPLAPPPPPAEPTPASVEVVESPARPELEPANDPPRRRRARPPRRSKPRQDEARVRTWTWD